MHDQNLLLPFITKYEANWGEWPARGKPAQQEHWRDMLAPIPATALGDLFATTQERWKNRKGRKDRPYVPEFEAAWAEIRHKYQAPPGRVTCQRCNGTGQISVPAAMPRKALGETRITFDGTKRPLQFYPFPCSLCGAGRQREEDWTKTLPPGTTLTKEAVFEANQQLVDAIRFCNIPDNDPLIRLRDFIRLRAAGKLPIRSPVGFLHELVSESWRYEAQRKGQDPSLFAARDLEASDTLNHLIKKYNAGQEVTVDDIQPQQSKEDQ